MKKQVPKLLVVSICAIMLTVCGNSTVTSANSNVPTVSQKKTDNSNVYNFADQCDKYLNYIGTHLKNRNIIPDKVDVPKDNTHTATQKWIISQLKKSGYQDSQITCQDYTYKTKRYVYSGKNIIVTLEGQNKDSANEKQVIVGGHYDGDGCGDNGSGVALLLATAVKLVDSKPLYPVKIIFFDGEEIGSTGASYYANHMTKKEVTNTLYMVNIDSIAFGDYCNIYGGVQDVKDRTISNTQAYELAVEKAKNLGMKVYTTKDLDGYYAKHGAGPKIKNNTLYTNPWTHKNPSPKNADYDSPTTCPYSDHAAFSTRGIPYVYFEATNWYADGNDNDLAYTGYLETMDDSLGYKGMFMNTPYDTLKNLKTLFPKRAHEHFEVFSPLLSSLILNPDNANECPAVSSN